MFKRQISLIGKENQDKLSQKEVLIVGCGGLGNIIATTLSCIGLKTIYLVDFDIIEIDNIHRQFQFSLNDVGKKKVFVLAEKIKRCNTKIIAIDAKFDSSFDLKVDIIFDATDNLLAREEIDKFAKKHNIPWVYASVEEFIGAVGLFKKTSFDIFAKKDFSSTSQFPPMVNLVGSIAGMVGIKELIFNQKEIFYFIDFENELEIKKFYIKE